MPYIQLQFRRGLASQWTSANTLLAEGEMGIETDTELFKIGDGVTRWNLLRYGGLHGPTGTTGPTGMTGSTGPTGPVAYGTNVASSYGYSQSFSVPGGQVTLCQYDSTYVQQGTTLASGGSGQTRIVVQSQGLYEIITSIQIGNTNSTPTNA
jgi:hypothetical protein